MLVAAMAEKGFFVDETLVSDFGHEDVEEADEVPDDDEEDHCS